MSVVRPSAPSRFRYNLQLGCVHRRASRREYVTMKTTPLSGETGQLFAIEERRNFECSGLRGIQEIPSTYVLSTTSVFFQHHHLGSWLVLARAPILPAHVPLACEKWHQQPLCSLRTLPLPTHQHSCVPVTATITLPPSLGVFDPSY